jgi:hypothetical protein
VDTLRRVLYVQAGVLFVAGLGLSVAPSLLLPHLLGTPTAFLRERAWARIAGVEAIGLSMLMVMVGHRVHELWWWSWAFALTTFAATAVVVLNAAFGLGAGESRLAWWLFALLMLALTSALLYGLYVSSREQPIP